MLRQKARNALGPPPAASSDLEASRTLPWRAKEPARIRCASETERRNSSPCSARNSGSLPRHPLQGREPGAGPDVPREVRQARPGVAVLPGGLRLEQRSRAAACEPAECGPLLAGGEVVGEAERVTDLRLAHHERECGDIRLLRISSRYIEPTWTAKSSRPAAAARPRSRGCPGRRRRTGGAACRSHRRRYWRCSCRPRGARRSR